MLIDHVCRKCGSTNLHRSRAVSFFEATARPVLPVYRCHTCSLRQVKLWFIKVGRRFHEMETATYEARW
ncbi:MAG TPA: hypothetical protein VGL82_07735 [Bryobacteraceae bacterium]|jgi:hypothetical protein